MNEDIAGEAARLRRRLEVARDRLDAILAGAGDRVGAGVAAVGAGPGEGIARIDDDDEIRALLQPAAARIARLVELTEAFADGTLPEASTGDAVRAVAGTQPHRRPR
ncbi:hypothetical protein [Dietzia sp. ANT_WB102]|uniref:hypothetical protein n=1 Tax=Dietzia sp. ANT_WB102 TaxID=2597345 RepID=UPI0011EDBC6F|nr:hypothetical protein [Dietzia sp. ANT_WB102]KAA0917946.1 hypothetical protein FQ137_00590 [Dietzia sp. ANT_WB102]